MNEEFLAFIKCIGEEIYELYFTKNPEAIWGENWNVCPSGIVPDISVDISSLSSTIRIKIDEDIILASKNTCFSMQDCIDGIIPLAFSSLNEEIENPLIFRFNESKEDVMNTIKDHNLEILFEEAYEDKSDALLSNLLDKLDSISNNDIDNFDF